MTRVVDASALAEYLLGTATGERVAKEVDGHALHAPHLVVTETISAIRGWVLGGHLDPGRAATACADLTDLPLHLWDARPLTPRVWTLRDRLSAYDATYVALAAALDAPLLTSDARLARGAPPGVAIRLV